MFLKTLLITIGLEFLAGWIAFITHSRNVYSFIISLFLFILVYNYLETK